MRKLKLGDKVKILGKSAGVPYNETEEQNLALYGHSIGEIGIVTFIAADLYFLDDKLGCFTQKDLQFVGIEIL